jgi:N-acyl amino acid synthase of PEP-CTERM/exosortase system
MSDPYERFTVRHIEREGSLKDLQDSYRLRYEVFCREEHFLAEEDYPDQLEHDGFDELSEHIVVRENESERIVGTVRLVRYSNELGFPTAAHFSDLNTKLAQLPLAKIYEISRLCISPLYRQRLVPKDGLYGVESYLEETSGSSQNGSPNRRKYPIILIYLIKKMYQIAVVSGGEYLIASMEAGLIRYLSMCGVESERLAGDYIEFYGKVMPCIIDIDKVLEKMSQKRPELYEFFIHDEKLKAS